MYSIKNNNKQALKWIRKGYKLADGDVDNDYYCSYISILAAAKQYKKALDLSDKALEKYPDDYRLLLSKISILQCKKDIKKLKKLQIDFSLSIQKIRIVFFMKLLCIQIVLKKKEIITK